MGASSRSRCTVRGDREHVQAFRCGSGHQLTQGIAGRLLAPHSNTVGARTAYVGEEAQIRRVDFAQHGERARKVASRASLLLDHRVGERARHEQRCCAGFAKVC